MDKQKILSSKKVFSAKLFDVKEEILLDHNGKKHTFHDVYAQPVASIIPITPKREIFLINQYRYMHEKHILGIVSGMIEKNETSLQAAKRELKEEAGIIAGQFELLAKIELARGTFQQTHFLFLAKDLEIGLQALESDEDISVVRMPLSEAVKKVMIGEIYHATSMIAILMLDKLKSERRL
ncbi:MAG TPA: NUDIX hydrolase [Patescibacteria group bacterium]|nr:NUDIX hydrolase [Patescibacteria group bacterium]